MNEIKDYKDESMMAGMFPPETRVKPGQYSFLHPKYPPYPDYHVAMFLRDLKDHRKSIVTVAEHLAWILGERLYEQPKGKPETIWRILYEIRISDLSDIELECRSNADIRREFQQEWFGERD